MRCVSLPLAPESDHPLLSNVFPDGSGRVEIPLPENWKRYGHFTVGAGYGHVFAGEFIQKATPGIGPTYLYVFHSFAL